MMARTPTLPCHYLPCDAARSAIAPYQLPFSAISASTPEEVPMLASCPASLTLEKDRGLFGKRTRTFLRMTVVRTKSADDAHQNSQDPATKPCNVREKRMVHLFRKLSQITEAICQMQCVLEAFRPCERGHIRRYIKQRSSVYEVRIPFPN